MRHTFHFTFVAAAFSLLNVLTPNSALAGSSSLGSNAVLLGPAAGTHSIVVTRGGAWTATANAPWLQSASSGSGNGLAVFTYDANTGATRTGTLDVAGQTFTVTQAGSTYVAANPVTTLVTSASLGQPFGVAVDSAGNVLIADSGNSRIQKWSPATNTVTTLLSSPSVRNPMGVAVDAAGNIYIADAGNVSVKKYTPSTQTLTTLVGSDCRGILGVAVDGDGNVFIGDAGNHVLKKWTAATQTVSTIVSTGLLGPLALAVDGSGNVYISDNLNHTIHKWTAATNVRSSLITGLNKPAGVAVDGAGNLYITDTSNNALKKWSPVTQTVTTLIGTGLSGPRGVAVDAAGNLYFGEQIGITVKELPYAFVNTAPKTVTSEAGADSVSAVLPASQNLLPPFAPSSNQPWLTLGAIAGGVINFSVAANPGTTLRVANISVLGKSIAVTQSGPPPVFSNVPPPVTREQASAAGAAVALTPPTAADFAGNPLSVSSNAPAVFPLGVTLVTFSAVDSFGAAKSASTSVTIVDTTPPVLAGVPAPVVVEQVNRNGTAVTLSLPTATDICDAAPVVTSDAPAVFPLGVTTVRFNATDASGNVGTATVTVTVKDTTPPTLANIPAPQVVEQTSVNGAPASVAFPTAIDICDASPVVTHDAPAIFPRGVTTVHFKATDASGNFAAGTTTVTVRDTTPPVLANVPAPISAEQSNRNGTAVSVALPAATDVGDGTVAVTSDAPAVFPLGATVVHYKATDASGNSATASTTVTIVDTTPPQLANVPANKVAEQADRNGTAVSVALPTATDICDAAPLVTSDAPGVFPLGVTTVRFTATDASGNSASASMTVTVRDTTAPVLANVPAAVTVEQSNRNGTSVNLAAPTATDICDASPVVSSDAPQVFPLGATTVHFKATDASGNSATGSTVVTVVDTTRPVLSNMPASVTVEQKFLSGTPVDLAEPTVSDICDAAPVLTHDKPAIFPLGITKVTFTARDASGNVATATTTVTVVDTTAPSLSELPAPVRAEQSSRNGTPAALALPGAFDICDAHPVVSSDAPAVFPLGVTSVKFTATDASGNSSSATTTVTIVDTTPPVLSNVPAPITVEESNATGTPVTIPMPTATDICDAAPRITSDAPERFQRGTTVVTFTATDASGNSSQAMASVTVTGGEPPPPPPGPLVFKNVPEPIKVEQSNRDGTPVTVPLPTVAGATVSSNAPKVFPLGKTTVTFTAKDNAGNTATAKTTVTVKDTTPPKVLELSASPNLISPPKGKWVEVKLKAKLSDICDASPNAKILSVTMNEKKDEKAKRHLWWWLKPRDWKVTGDMTLKVKSKLNDGKKERVYTITVASTDASGNMSKKDVEVKVKEQNGSKDGKK